MDLKTGSVVLLLVLAFFIQPTLAEDILSPPDPSFLASDWWNSFVVSEDNPEAAVTDHVRTTIESLKNMQRELTGPDAEAAA